MTSTRISSVTASDNGADSEPKSGIVDSHDSKLGSPPIGQYSRALFTPVHPPVIDLTNYARLCFETQSIAIFDRRRNLSKRCQRGMGAGTWAGRAPGSAS